MRSSRSAWLARSGIVGLALVLASPVEAHADDKECMSSASSGQELRDQGKLLEARGLFQACAVAACPAPVPTYCGDWLSDVARKIPTLVLRVVDDGDHDATDATLLLDGRPLEVDGRPVEVDPGKHHVRASRPGSKTSEMDVVAAQGEKDRIVVVKLAPEELEPRPIVLPEARPSPLERVPTASWIAWGVGAAGLVSFSAFGLKARLDYDGYESTCGGHCTLADRDSVARSATVADVSLVVGLVGAGVGTVLFLMQPRASAETHTASRSR